MSFQNRSAINLSAALAKGLVGFWSLADGGVRDEVSGAAATPVGTTRGNSAVGAIRAFNGTSDRIPLPLVLSGFPATVVTLARITAAASSFPVLWGAGNSVNTSDYILLGADGTAGGIRMGQNSVFAVGSTNICDAKWHVVGGTWASSGMTGYVDGRPDGISSGSPIYPSVNQGAIGCLPRSSLVSLAGADVAFVGVWNRALSAREMRDLAADTELLFTPRKRASRFYVGTVSALTLSGANQAGSGAETTGAVIQTQVLAGPDQVGAGGQQAGALAQVHALAGPGQAGAGAETTGALAQLHSLAGTPQAGTGGQSAGNVGQVQALAGADQANAGGQTAGTLGQVHALAGMGQGGAGTQTDGALTEITHVLTVSPQTGIGAQAPGRVEQAHVLAGLNQLGTPQITVGAIIGRGLGILINPTARRVTPARDLRSTR